MRVLVVENFENTGLGQVGIALRQAGAEIDLRRAHRGDTLPADAAGHAAAVVLGGGQNALDDATSPYFPALLDLILDFDRRDRAVLGICLGSQLMARAHGGTNQVGGASEFGWHIVTRDAAAASDAVLGAAPAHFPIFQWHDDTFSLPPGAVRLASSPVAENQAFRVGRAGYGIQFHFEADTALVRDWNAKFAEHLSRHQPGWFDRHRAEEARHGAAADAAGAALARAWVGLI